MTDVLKHSEVVFMGRSSPEMYRTYGAGFVGWGGDLSPEEVKKHRTAGVRCAASMWCLTAGAEALHKDLELRGAVSVDIEGKPVEIPWQFEKVYQGTKTLFGCTNNPVFRAHCAESVRKVMRGKPDGLHVDDHASTAMSAWYFGGGLCDHCIEAFRQYLEDNMSLSELAAEGVEDIETFDYRDVIKKYAKTREDYLRTQYVIPLMDRFRKFHAEAAAEHVRQLGIIAAETAGYDITLSANACLPDELHTYVLKNLTHVICEVVQNASSGTADIDNALEAYSIAREHKMPLAATASGKDWDFIKANQAEGLVKFWIALAYASGQRFMVPHPSRQWCFCEKEGTHWYSAPVDEFAPLYRFIGNNAHLLDGFKRQDPVVECGDDVVVTLRGNTNGQTAVHIVNRAYDTDSKRVLGAGPLKIMLPAGLGTDVECVVEAEGSAGEAKIKRSGSATELGLSSLGLWTIVLVS